MVDSQCLERVKPAHPDLNDRGEMGLMLALVSWVPCCAAHESEQDIKHQVNGRCSDNTEL